MQKQKDQVMQPVTMAILIAIIVILSELPSFSALINSSSPSTISRKLISLSVAETMGKNDEPLPSNFVSIPVFGDIYLNGFYYVSMEIGNPSKSYFLEIDTGSDLTWLPKVLYESQSMRYKRCDESLCNEVKCKNTVPCDYEISYHDGATSRGLLVTDTFTLQLKGGSSITPTLVIGSGAYHSPSTGPNSRGMLGLGKGKISILSQLRENGLFANIFGHCLSSNPGVSGFMFIGSDFNYFRSLSWADMSTDIHSYSFKVDGVYADDKPLGWYQDVIFDCGTPNTYFLDPLYKQLLSVITKTKLQKAPGDEDYRYCWKGTKSFKSISEIIGYFPTLKIKFGRGQVFEIPPNNYFIIRETGVACLGIFNGGDKELSNLIGAISMQNVVIVYDNEQQKIGWARVAGCRNPPVGP